MPPIDLNITLVASIEFLRRERKYAKMRDFARKFERGRDGTKHCIRLASKVNYELHMAEFQQFEEGARGARQHLLKSCRFAEQSVRDAYAGDDTVGALFALANITGLIMPLFRVPEPCLLLSWSVGSEAEAIARDPATSVADRRRAQRVAMNTYFHRIRIAMSAADEVIMRLCIREWLQRVKENPVYISMKDELRPDVEAAEKFIANATAEV